MINQYLYGDCLERLRTLPEKSVHCVVTLAQSRAISGGLFLRRNLLNKINHFKRKGGLIVWIEGMGSQATWVGESKKVLLDKETNDIYRVERDEEWDNPPRHMTRCKVIF